jgi:hypothetical protein
MSPRLPLLLLLALPALSQTVPFPDPPPFSPDDPEGFVPYPNRTGRYPWKRKGAWTVSPLRPAPSPAISATLDSLSALLQATPEGARRLGWFLKEHRRYFPANPYDLPPGRTPASLPLLFESSFYPFYLADDLRNGAYVQVTGGETQGITFLFNRLPGPLQQPVIASEPVPDRAPVAFFLRPDARTLYRGLPVLDRQVLLLTRPGRDPYAPVPYARALRAALVEFEKDRLTAVNRLASLRAAEAETLSPAYEQAQRDHLEKNSGAFKTADPAKYALRLQGMERSLAYARDQARRAANPQRDPDGAWYWNPLDAHADAERRLAALTPADSAAPACYLPAPQEKGRYAIRGRILPAGADPLCQPLVMQNFDYFDPKLPRHVPQILTVLDFGRCFQPGPGELRPYPLPAPGHSAAPPQGCFRHVPMWEALDWSRVAALLAP